MCFTPVPNFQSEPSVCPAMGGAAEQHGHGSEPLERLLEHAACDDLPGFVRAAEDASLSLNATSLWYGRWWTTYNHRKAVRYEQRTPLMVAALYGSASVVQYILSNSDSTLDVNRPCGSDSATALHCAAAGGSYSSLHVVKLLLAAGADVHARDAGGLEPVDVLSKHHHPSTRSRIALETLLRGGSVSDVEEEEEVEVLVEKKAERKEYPVDATLPDIKSGIYGTDEFRMYSFKVKPCSRAYSHDWTECPFVHPGENARRRDPRKYHYSCVPCPDFRKGSCRSGDSCEYAHGVFESWLHPAQYRTRLCKDEVGCNRRVCFFAHKPEELRPLYPSSAAASNGGGSSSPRALPPLDLGAAAMLLGQSPMSPSTSSALGWLGQSAGMLTPGSRLKAGVSSRDMEMDLELMGFDGYAQLLQQKQQLMEEINSLSPPTSWANTMASASRSGEYGDLFGSLDSSALLSPVKNLSLKQGPFQSPTAIQKHQQLLSGGYGSPNLPSSPSSRGSSSAFSVDHSVAASLMNSRASAFAKRSQSFIDRGASTRLSNFSAGPMSPVAAAMTSSPLPALSNWGSPDGKVDWAIQGEELNKLRKSSSFAYRGNGPVVAATGSPVMADEPDVSWVQSLVRDGPSGDAMKAKKQYRLNSGAGEFRPAGDNLPAWADQLYMEQEQMVA